MPEYSGPERRSARAAERTAAAAYDGSIVPGSNMTPGQLKAAIKAKL